MPFGAIKKKNMQKLRVGIFPFLFLMATVGCKTQKEKLEFSYPTDGKRITQGEIIDVQLKFPFSEVDSVVYTLDGEKIETKTDTSGISLATESVAFGSRSLRAKLYGKGEEKIAYSTIHILPARAKDISYEVTETYPHDDGAFTQGLEYDGQHLYESTGIKGESTLRRVDLKTGKVLQKVDLDKEYFGEGLTLIGNKVIQLTWRSNLGIVYDKSTFKKREVFSYKDSKEGWGICYDGERLIKSDGSDRLYFLNANTYQEESYITVYDHEGPVNNINELEYINGMVWANIYTKDMILVIDPNTGAVTGKLNFIGLYTEERDPYDNEMNGIAYDKKNDRIFVTGKKWNKLFELKIKED